MILFTIDSFYNSDNKKFIEELYNEYMPWLRLRAHRKIEDLNVCDDLAHDCMLNMIKHIEKLKSLDKDRQRAYLFVSIDNLVLNYIKRSNKIITVKNESSAELDFVGADCDVVDEVSNKYDYDTIKAGLDNLCERDRDIIKMKYDLDLDDGQIADVLQIKKDCVRMTVSRSIKRLKKELKKLEGK